MQNSAFRKTGIIISVTIIVLGVGMMLAPLTPIGPSAGVGLVFGGLLVLSGALRLWWTLRRHPG